MATFELRESGASQKLALPDELGRAINALGIATALPEGGGQWTVSGVSKVGVIAVGSDELSIRPKMPMSRLFFLMGYSQAPRYWRDDDVSLSSDDELVSSIASAYIRQVKKATVQGLLQGYRTVHEAEPMIRGRLDVPGQIGRRAGLPLPAEVSYDDYTVDVAENRLLLSAARTLLTVPRLAESDRQSLRKLLLKFDGVASIARGAAPPEILFTRLNAHYRPAAILAQIILRHGSLEQPAGEVAARSFLFDMWEVFEDFVSVALREAMDSSDGRIDLQYAGKHLDVGAKVALRPDIVWHKDDVVLAVLDAKYKAEKNKRFPNADLYQMLAYCTRFKMKVGHLVYAKADNDEVLHQIDGADIHIYSHALDLEAKPEHLLQQVQNLAAKMVDRSNVTT
ncbi:restriction endonuclease [Arthrobacter sp. UKPF54-2]|uniref:McrC family protein n=1 Tax=Arthrobacter sp. UKPF54-2 TaxID=2600159 RepID=UPI0011B18BDC|nr:restriction endonuclease [Arthrobacter sp. UKPF54-2]QDY89049.1 restriction endonuclease [Arthrobacter sp. UKPF54-2]